MHLVLDAFLEADGTAEVSGDADEITRRVVVIGLGNGYRKDDGVGIAAAEAVKELALPRVRVTTKVADPLNLLEAWRGAELAVVIDAAEGSPSIPGRVRRCTVDDVADVSAGLSSHSIDIGQTQALGRVLGRVPDAIVLLTVDVADTGHGVGLTPRVANAVPEVVSAVLREINGGRGF